MACDCVLCINDVVATFVFEPMVALKAALADSLSAIFRGWAEPWKALPRTYQYSFCCHRLKIRHVLAVCPWANQMQKTEFARFLCAFNLKHEPLLKPVRSEIRNSRISVSVRINYLDKTLESNNFVTFNHHFGTVPNHSNQRARNNFHGSVKTITLRFVSIILSQYW